MQRFRQIGSDVFAAYLALLPLFQCLTQVQELLIELCYEIRCNKDDVMYIGLINRPYFPGKASFHYEDQANEKDYVHFMFSVSPDQLWAGCQSHAYLTTPNSGSRIANQHNRIARLYSYTGQGNRNNLLP